MQSSRHKNQFKSVATVKQAYHTDSHLVAYLIFDDAQICNQMRREKVPGYVLTIPYSKKLCAYVSPLIPTIIHLLGDATTSPEVAGIFNLTILIWFDAAFYEGRERTAVKVAIEAPFFPKGRSKLATICKMDGFESSLFNFTDLINGKMKF